MKTIVENKVPLFGLGYPVTEHFTGDAWNIMPPKKASPGLLIGVVLAYLIVGTLGKWG